MHKTPRKLELQPDLKNEAEEVQLINFDQSFTGKSWNIKNLGIIESHVFHYGGEVEDVLQLFLTT